MKRVNRALFKACAKVMAWGVGIAPTLVAAPRFGGWAVLLDAVAATALLALTLDERGASGQRDQPCRSRATSRQPMSRRQKPLGNAIPSTAA